jgi:diguanylate cyclase (GGDEF)-like protein
MGSRPKQFRAAKPAAAPARTGRSAAVEFSIPEFTPNVSAAISALRHEIRRLEDLLQESRSRVEELLRTADQDILLPVLNRRALMREIARFIAFAERYGTRSSLLFLDIDGFKTINDAYGHAAGDSVLRQCCEFLAANIRSSDILSRVGGDEFAIIFPAIPAQQAREKGKLLSRRLAERASFWNGVPVSLTFASGACELVAGMAVETALEEADRDMYAAKRNSGAVTTALGI